MGCVYCWHYTGIAVYKNNHVLTAVVDLKKSSEIKHERKKSATPSDTAEHRECINIHTNIYTQTHTNTHIYIHMNINDKPSSIA